MLRVVVVGGGPAGIAAADAAAHAGADTTLVDGEPVLGGQYHRGSPQLADPRVRHLPNSTVWALEGLRLHLRTGPADSPDRTGHVLDADALVLATGAHDRVVPFPGWDLPGVYTAGGAQALAKGHDITIGQRVVVSGTGPFLLPVAESLLTAGADVLEVCEANSGLGWLRHPRALTPSKLRELARYAKVLARHRVPWHTRTAVVAAHGADRVSAVTVAQLTSNWTVTSTRRVVVDAVCVGHGFTPRLELAVAAGCELLNGFVKVDDTGRTTVEGVYAAGEITGIGGADLAAAEGAAAGAAAAGAPTRPVQKRFVHALAAAHPVRDGWQSWLTDDTVVCRCEEVTSADLRKAHDFPGLRTAKLVTRAGLGLCQGRTCLRNVSEILGAQENHRRPIVVPVRLGELAGLEEEP